jgi:hypothetical protein
MSLLPHMVRRIFQHPSHLPPTCRHNAVGNLFDLIGLTDENLMLAG